MFDVEAPQRHPRLAEAVQTARSNHTKVAISNPCFELWLLLHYTNHNHWIDNDACRAMLRRHDTSPGKGLDGAAYMPLRRDAASRARHLARQHEHNGRDHPRDNPSSGVYRLLEAVAAPNNRAARAAESP